MMGRTVMLSAGVIPMIVYPQAAYSQEAQALVSAQSQEEFSKALKNISEFSPKQFAGLERLQNNVDVMFDNLMSGKVVLSATPAPAEVSESESEAERAPPKIAEAKTYLKDAFAGMKMLISGRSGLPIDKGVVLGGKITPIQTTTSPTNIGMMLIQYVSRRDMKIVSEEEARDIILAALNTMSSMEKDKSGLFYAWYETDSEKPYATNRYIPSIDNANLTAALKIVAEAYKNDTSAKGKEISK
jgi:hypothetical protein